MKIVEYRSKNHGFVSIVKYKSYYYIWLDPEECGTEGFKLGDDDNQDWYLKEFFTDADFSDLPEKGRFVDFLSAKNYIETKFGVLY